MTAVVLGPGVFTLPAAAGQHCTIDLPVTASAGIWGQPVKPDMNPYQAVVKLRTSGVTFHFLKRPSVTVFPLGPIPEPTGAIERNLQLHLHKAGMAYLRQCGGVVR